MNNNEGTRRSEQFSQNDLSTVNKFWVNASPDTVEDPRKAHVMALVEDAWREEAAKRFGENDPSASHRAVAIGRIGMLDEPGFGSRAVEQTGYNYDAKDHDELSNPIVPVSGRSDADVVLSRESSGKHNRPNA
jgi:hypothetical protein